MFQQQAIDGADRSSGERNDFDLEKAAGGNVHAEEYSVCIKT